ncbi:MAG: site-specific DNA-methyltransferase [Armatimonadetes bacterium]|nr:site-specific DNA-methyltransferase [Armatimonadota bacterium]
MSDQASPSNKLNDLTNRDWLRETKSFWMSRASGMPEPAASALSDFVDWLLHSRDPQDAEEILSQLDDSFVFSRTPPRSKLKALHPATFSELDVERLIRFFTKTEERVLDPFVGSGSTLIACANCERSGVGIELSEQWADIARRRIEQETSGGLLTSARQEVLVGDALEMLKQMPGESVDFVVTSPPYWSILTKKAGLKVQAEREAKGLPTQYSQDKRDLGNVEDYEEFLALLTAVFAECGRVLRAGRYMAVVVSDFRHGSRFYLYHAHLAERIEAVGIPLRGVTILAQDNKNLYPFGVPNQFVSNIHHQYILVFQRPK